MNMGVIQWVIHGKSRHRIWKYTQHSRHLHTSSVQWVWSPCLSERYQNLAANTHSKSTIQPFLFSFLVACKSPCWITFIQSGLDNRILAIERSKSNCIIVRITSYCSSAAKQLLVQRWWNLFAPELSIQLDYRSELGIAARPVTERVKRKLEKKYDVSSGCRIACASVPFAC